MARYLGDMGEQRRQAIQSRQEPPEVVADGLQKPAEPLQAA